MLIDDNPDDNFYHERVIRKNSAVEKIIIKQTAQSALDYLKSRPGDDIRPDIIFLDINMPGMNGWDFLDAYEKLDESVKSRAIIVMLTTSENPDDKQKSLLSNNVSEFRTKPLTKEIIQDIVSKYFIFSIVLNYL